MTMLYFPPSLFFPYVPWFPVLGPHLFPPVSVCWVFLFSQLPVITLWGKMINSDPVLFVTRFSPDFYPICPAFCKLIPLGRLISHIRCVIYQNPSDVLFLQRHQPLSKQHQATGPSFSLRMPVPPFGSLLTCNLGLPKMSGLG